MNSVCTQCASQVCSRAWNSPTPPLGLVGGFIMINQLKMGSCAVLMLIKNDREVNFVLVLVYMYLHVYLRNWWDYDSNGAHVDQTNDSWTDDSSATLTSGARSYILDHYCYKPWEAEPHRNWGGRQFVDHFEVGTLIQKQKQVVLHVKPKPFLH